MLLVDGEPVGDALSEVVGEGEPLEPKDDELLLVPTALELGVAVIVAVTLPVSDGLTGTL